MMTICSSTVVVSFIHWLTRDPGGLRYECCEYMSLNVMMNIYCVVYVVAHSCGTLVQQ
jgi:hypothetical protein